MTTTIMKTPSGISYRASGVFAFGWIIIDIIDDDCRCRGCAVGSPTSVCGDDHHVEFLDLFSVNFLFDVNLSIGSVDGEPTP